MENGKNFRLHVQKAYNEYRQMDNDGQAAALNLVAELLRKMLRDSSGRRHSLTELGGTTKTGTETRTNTEKARAKLIRKSNAVSPQAPIKPVQTTSKNELRRT
ncbi:hypothetical protein SAMN05216227_103616 [Pseudorhodobacter antarcticus]|uniref:Uncharacterized protein n=1 Tax=Pseudorhodobacter antarcticus TaxID=1077947 RepID=A0A1H8KX68_9RHOB|nr:hypothetical protein [Pseudorhodobacter antarcticus]SEN97522.1 hypothetical protein SAMN05216227_103616 [Pseudorhodobacter antarcticus]